VPKEKKKEFAQSNRRGGGSDKKKSSKRPIKKDEKRKDKPVHGNSVSLPKQSRQKRGVKKKRKPKMVER